MADQNLINALKSPRIQPTPAQYPWLAKVADALRAGSDMVGKPFGYDNPPVQALTNFLGVPAVANTMDNIAYGMPLTKGRGQTLQMTPDTTEALMAVSPFAPAVGKAAIKGAKYIAPEAANMAVNLAEKGGMPIRGMNIVEFDKRFDPRMKEQQRLKDLFTQVEQNKNALVKDLSLVDFEGRPFLTSMSDRTAAGGSLVGINGKTLNRPVELLGGQDYMFNNEGNVWASAKAPVKQILDHAQTIKEVTGQNPLFMPWRMAPTGGDFAAMTGETMLSYADTAMTKGQKRSLNKQMKTFIPDWSGVESPQSVDQFRNAPDRVRKAIKNMMDVEFRDAGGLNIGEARLAVTDPKQYMAPDAGIMNVGEIFADKPMQLQSNHTSYPMAVAGQGLGRLKENHNVFELLPDVVKMRGMANPLNPRATDIRALQMKPYAGIIDDKLLKALGY